MLNLSNPKVMGILNVTPDSFSDGGKYNTVDAALKQAETMLSNGADILDIGAMSSRPGAELISSDEELFRLMPVLEAILNRFPNTIISIDTVYGKTAKASLEVGASIINDISAFNIDKSLLEVIAEYKCPYILMHSTGKPATMQNNLLQENVVREVALFLKQKLNQLVAKKITDVIIDPGFGFGKTIEQNYHLLNHISYLKDVLELPFLVGVSRKSMLYKPLNSSPKNADNATTVAHTLALLNGANILRTHSVKQAKEAIKIVDLYLSYV